MLRFGKLVFYKINLQMILPLVFLDLISHEFGFFIFAMLLNYKINNSSPKLFYAKQTTFGA